MKILAVNCGSSSLKFRLLELSSGNGAKSVAEGTVRIGPAGKVDFQKTGGKRFAQNVSILKHAEAMRLLGQWLEDKTNFAREIDAIGHRVVHGGTEFAAPVLIDPGVTEALERLRELAPLHNGPAVEAIRECRAIFGDSIPMVATFDTAFHARLPEHARRYAIPEELTEKHGLWRYGFHGLAHRWMMERYCALAKRRIEETKLITMQLGSGCSAAAIERGRSIETSMGVTPCEGLMMATRSGDVDPSLPGLLAQREELKLEEVEELLNKRSGLRGVDGGNRDVPDILQAAARGERRAALAVEMFCHRVRKYLGAYLAVLRGADAVVFGGGIGENAPMIRATICSGMEWCGIHIDSKRNEGAIGREARITADDSALQVYVIPVNEEALIARDTRDCVQFSNGGERERRVARKRRKVYAGFNNDGGGGSGRRGKDGT